jgi:hypothetical protein
MDPRPANNRDIDLITVSESESTNGLRVLARIISRLMSEIVHHDLTEGEESEEKNDRD